MELEDIIRGEQYLNLFSAQTDKHRYKNQKETASKLVGFAYNYFFELTDKKENLEKSSSNSIDLLGVRWNLTDADRNIRKIVQLRADYDRIINEAKSVFNHSHYTPTEKNELGLSYVTCLNEINKALKFEFSQLISSAKSYHSYNS